MAAHDLSAGHTLLATDLSLMAMPANSIASDALTDTKLAIGQTLKIDRGTGDILRTSNLGQMITLQPDERAVAVKITDSTGLIGLLVPGQKVGIVASIPMQSQNTQGTFSKATIEGLKSCTSTRALPLLTHSSSSSMQSVNSSSSTNSLTGTSGVNTSSRAGSDRLRGPGGPDEPSNRRVRLQRR